jgi:hypothetical protein
MVYFIECDGCVKVGYTNGESAEARLLALRTGNPRSMRLLAVISGGQAAERRIHGELSDFRVAGEWFAVCVGSRRVLSQYMDVGQLPAASPVEQLTSIVEQDSKATTNAMRARMRELVQMAYYAGVGASQVAERIEVPWALMNSMINGRRPPSADVLTRIEQLVLVDLAASH